MANYETQVVVIAAGPSGLSAAVQAAEDGAEVIVLEKAAAVGGAANMGMGPLGIGTKYQKKQMEDAEIIKAIRSMKMDSRKMLTFLDGIQNGTVTMQFDEEGNLSMDSSETGIKKEENMDREMSTGLIEEREDLEDEE